MRTVVSILALFILLTNIKVQAQNNTIDSLEQLYKKQSRLLNEMRAYIEHYDLDSAIHYSNRLLELGNIKKDQQAKGMGLYSLGSALDYEGLPNSAEAYYIQALDLFKKIKDNDNIISTLGAYSFIFFQRNEPETVLKLRLEALEISEQTKDRTLILISQTYLIEAYLNQENSQTFKKRFGKTPSQYLSA